MTNEFNPDWMCVCGDLTTLGVVHRKDGPCYMPEPNREWVGLTDEEVVECWVRPNMFHIAHAIEAKLKEKNNG
jgi:hypothetical protein